MSDTQNDTVNCPSCGPIPFTHIACTECGALWRLEAVDNDDDEFIALDADTGEERDDDNCHCGVRLHPEYDNSPHESYSAAPACALCVWKNRKCA